VRLPARPLWQRGAGCPGRPCATARVNTGAPSLSFVRRRVCPAPNLGPRGGERSGAGGCAPAGQPGGGRPLPASVVPHRGAPGPAAGKGLKLGRGPGSRWRRELPPGRWGAALSAGAEGGTKEQGRAPRSFGRLEPGGSEIGCLYRKAKSGREAAERGSWGVRESGDGGWLRCHGASQPATSQPPRRRRSGRKVPPSPPKHKYTGQLRAGRLACASSTGNSWQNRKKAAEPPNPACHRRRRAMHQHSRLERRGLEPGAGWPSGSYCL